MSVINVERLNRYDEHILIEENLRTYTNPDKDSIHPIPTDQMEILIQNIITPCHEDEFLPYFERFGPVYKLNLLTNNNTRTCAFLTYYLEVSAITAIEVMKHFIRRGRTMYVTKPVEKFSIFALNIAHQMNDRAIERQLASLFSKAERITVTRQQETESGAPNICAAMIDFPNLAKAQAAINYGPLILWGKTVTFDWENPSRRSYLISNEIKDILIHNLNESVNIEEFKKIMFNYIYPHEIISTSQVNRMWLVEFTNKAAANTIKTLFADKTFEGSEKLRIDWTVGNKKVYSQNGDFDAELRLFCIANFWEPPVFIYGRAFPREQIQHCAVIMKEQGKSTYATFLLEMFVDQVIEVHSRASEIVLQYLFNTMRFPAHNLVVKSIYNQVFIIGSIANLELPKLRYSPANLDENLTLYYDDIFMLSKMCSKVLQSSIGNIYEEYQLILKNQCIQRQFITNITSDGNVLGCIDPNYRIRKPMKHDLITHYMMLVMCDLSYRSNVMFPKPSIYYHIMQDEKSNIINLKFDKYLITTVDKTQYHIFESSSREFIEFNQTDTFSRLYKFLETSSFE